MFEHTFGGLWKEETWRNLNLVEELLEEARSAGIFLPRAVVVVVDWHTVRTRINDLVVGSPKFPPLEKWRKTHQKSAPQDLVMEEA